MENLLQTEEEGDSKRPYLRSLNLSLEMWRIEEMVLEMVLEIKEQLQCKAESLETLCLEENK